MHHRRMLGILAGLALLLIAVFMLIKVNSNNWDYVIPKRSFKIAAIVLTGSAIAYSSLVFQTITNNRILTPSIIGLDSLYMLLQTFVVFAFGSSHLVIADKNMNFLISAGLMVLFAGILFKLLFRREGNNIYFLLLVGIIVGGLFRSLSSFMQMLIDPNEFQILQDKMFASFNNINTDILLIAAVGLFLVAVYVLRYTKMLDVLSLGREHAVNLGIPYDKIVKRMLIVVAILISISTALVGPITFLGLLVVNVAREFLKTYQHKFLIPGTILISIIALVGGQLIVERVFTFNTTLSVIVNFVGGIYFIYLLLKENKAW